MKRYINVKIIFIILFAVLIVGYLFLFNRPANETVDCSGRVDEIEINSSEEYVVITIHETIDDYDYIYKIEIPFDWKCKDRDGKGIAVTDIKVGYSISLNFDGTPVYKDGIIYAKPKGTIEVR